MQYDLVLKDGHVIDPSQKIDAIMDVAIHDGKIAAIAKSIEGGNKIESVANAYVVPGLIDCHAHVYWGGTSLSVNADDIAERSATSTFVDAGSSGPGNFVGFLEHVIKRSSVNIFSFLNISFAGIFGFSERVMLGEASLLELMNVEEVVEICKRYPDYIVGIKVRACQRGAKQHGLAAIELALEAADLVNLPIMTHIGYPPPNVDDVTVKLRRGDIITHAFRDSPNSFVTQEGVIRDSLYVAREKGILLDIGHGMGGFGFRVARRLAKEGIWPDMISSDIHILSVNGPAYDLLTTMSKFLCLGMPLQDIIAAVTMTPARMMKKPMLGTLAVGAPADVAVLTIEKGQFIYQDGAKQILVRDQRFAVQRLLRPAKSL